MIINASIEVNNVPNTYDQGYMVARHSINNGVSELWYYGVYETEEKANAASSELGNGVVFWVVGNISEYDNMTGSMNL